MELSRTPVRDEDYRLLLTKVLNPPVTTAEDWTALAVQASKYGLLLDDPGVTDHAYRELRRHGWLNETPIA